MSTFGQEIARGRRFEFGKNWADFLRVLDDERIAEAVRGLQQSLQVSDLSGRSFLDVGSGSGLSSLAAMRLNAARVHSFDFDPTSVRCTQELRRRYFTDTTNWTVDEGSALDRSYLASLGQFDVVYSWGVLHHTGAMWQALANMVGLVRPGGLLALALYNNQGRASKRWRGIKRAYNRNLIGRLMVITVVGGYYTARQSLGDMLRGHHPLARIKDYKSARGMSWSHDLLDWLGGLPFEVASVEAVDQLFRLHGFKLEHVVAVNSWANNEFLFRRV
jgi:2-polyprenyl-3-methyl-5-hydroxy-6-metoxy-1,4-benzoquinol methylase